MEQHSREWFIARLGRWTGSEVGKLMQAGRSKAEVFGETAKGYIYDKASERLLRDEVRTDGAIWNEYYTLTHTSNKAMEFGTEQEPYARKRYRKMTGYDVHEVGLLLCKELPEFGSSPDGLAMEDGKVTRAVEIKCPLGNSFVKYAVMQTAEDLKKVNAQYYWQCVSHCIVSGAKVCDFVLFNPFLCPDARLKVMPIQPTPEDIALLLERVRLAEALCREIVERIKSKRNI